mmetsp:Transcript_45107/g.89395  ORF Transcript_45107/g.89395 Transcript_45107/m.89395 type:complete len:88 (+) Transcript_45107:1508-1771(+)
MSLVTIFWNPCNESLRKALMVVKVVMWMSRGMRKCETLRGGHGEHVAQINANQQHVDQINANLPGLLLDMGIGDGQDKVWGALRDFD